MGESIPRPIAAPARALVIASRGLAVAVKDEPAVAGARARRMKRYAIRSSISHA